MGDGRRGGTIYPIPLSRLFTLKPKCKLWNVRGYNNICITFKTRAVPFVLWKFEKIVSTMRARLKDKEEESRVQERS